ncbi:hypothetical protein Pyrde_0961 [Pyrodictium delaneyi]|uniref:Uncharacterized protein n=1 Tax=Pyrodictium delaneyi TaxID=1273541 RepID=A0A0N7JD25_9CREN|nr:hypothetical protein [Pyrodictium delaneyi]ALL01009.1 hypothetical protein Pyrde_0961 [Pyrodictium delaneyi]OWJ55391.1 hypothetical protein Pdsh_00835 [Pyrodictium delaneyi]
MRDTLLAAIAALALANVLFAVAASIAYNTNPLTTVRNIYNEIVGEDEQIDSVVLGSGSYAIFDSTKASNLRVTIRVYVYAHSSSAKLCNLVIPGVASIPLDVELPSATQHTSVSTEITVHFRVDGLPADYVEKGILPVILEFCCGHTQYAVIPLYFSSGSIVR